MKKTRLAAALSALVMIFSMTACENGGSSSSSEAASSVSKSSSSSQSAETVSISEEDQQFRISCDDYSMTIKTISGLTEWEKDSYKRKDFNTVYVHAYAPMFYCCFNVYPQPDAEKLIEKHKNKGYKTGTLSYQGKTVSYSIEYLIPEEKLIKKMTLHMPIGDGYVKEVGLSSGGTIYHNLSENGEEIETWVKNNKQRYTELSDDPEQYLYLFSAFA